MDLISKNISTPFKMHENGRKHIKVQLTGGKYVPKTLKGLSQERKSTANLQGRVSRGNTSFSVGGGTDQPTNVNFNTRYKKVNFGAGASLGKRGNTYSASLGFDF